MVISDQELIQLLTKMSLLDEKKVKDVQEYMKNASASFDDALLQLNFISDEQLGITVANYLKIPFVNLSKVSIPQDVFHIVPEKIARNHKVIAFGRDQSGIKIAMADPKNSEIIALISQKTQSKVIPYLATPHDINNTFYIFKKDLQKAFDELVKSKTNDKFLKEAPVAQIVDLMIETAYFDKVSDIHIEPQENEALVRYRMDGILHDMLSYPKGLHDRIMTRLKVRRASFSTRWKNQI